MDFEEDLSFISPNYDFNRSLCLMKFNRRKVWSLDNTSHWLIFTYISHLNETERKLKKKKPLVMFSYLLPGSKANSLWDSHKSRPKISMLFFFAKYLQRIQILRHKCGWYLWHISSKDIWFLHRGSKRMMICTLGDFLSCQLYLAPVFKYSSHNHFESYSLFFFLNLVLFVSVCYLLQFFECWYGVVSLRSMFWISFLSKH